MPPHRRPQAASRGADARGALSSRSAALPGRALLIAGLLAAASLLPASPVAAAPATHRQAAAAARPAKATQAAARPARDAQAAARPASATADRPQQARRAVRRHRVPGTDGSALADAGQGPMPAAHGPAFATASPRAACLAAAREAERAHGLPEGLMVAIALSESGLHAHALNLRGRAHFPEDRDAARALVARAGGRGFAGCVQISLGHARGSDWPLDPARATDWAGALLARAHAETGSWSAAVARFHGGSPAGSRRVICRVRAKLEVAAPGSPALTDAPCGGDMARERRNGAALLEIAEAQ